MAQQAMYTLIKRCVLHTACLVRPAGRQLASSQGARKEHSTRTCTSAPPLLPSLSAAPVWCPVQVLPRRGAPPRHAHDMATDAGAAAAARAREQRVAPLR